MKRYFLFLPILAVVVCTACIESKSEFTPFVQTSAFFVNPTYRNDSIVSAEDTIVPQMSSSGIYVLDTIDRNDKVVFQIAFGGIENELKAVRITHDTLQLNMLPQLGTVQNNLDATSNVRLIQLVLNPGYNYVTFPVIYTPMKSGVFDFTATVESDSQFSPRSVQFRQPVR